jgi:hypothetical protein
MLVTMKSTRRKQSDRKLIYGYHSCVQWETMRRLWLICSARTSPMNVTMYAIIFNFSPGMPTLKGIFCVTLLDLQKLHSSAKNF